MDSDKIEEELSIFLIFPIVFFSTSDYTGSGGVSMLIEFRFRNYRSFRDDAVLSMEATGLGALKSILIPFHSITLLPGAAIFGKNGGGKSNVIRAFWLAVQFIRNAQRTQHEKAAIPVVPFALNDYSASEPTEFEF